MPVFLIALQEATAPGSGVGMQMVLRNVIMIGAFLAIFWFLLIRPQRQLQQKHTAMVGGLKKGDEIMTEGGIIGQVVHLGEDRITLKTAENTRIVVARSKIARIFGPETADAPKPS